MTKRWLDVNEAAEYLKLKKTHLYSMAQGRAAVKGPPVSKVGKYLRYDIKDLDRWIDALPRRNGMK